MPACFSLNRNHCRAQRIRITVAGPAGAGGEERSSSPLKSPHGHAKPVMDSYSEAAMQKPERRCRLSIGPGTRPRGDLAARTLGHCRFLQVVAVSPVNLALAGDKPGCEECRPQEKGVEG